MFLGWLFYALALAFYSAALTMFFSTSPDISIESTSDVLQQNDWELIVVRGFDAYIESYASSGNELFESLKNDLKTGKKKYSDTLEVTHKVL